MLEDFEQTYDGDFTDSELLEAAANFYLYWPAMLQMLGTDIERAFDLLPNDLRGQCLRVQQERRLLDAKPQRKAFDFFISHASEDKKEIALPLAEQLKSLGA